MNVETKAVKLGQISDQFETLEREVKRYEELVAMAEQRFAPVIRQENTSKGGDPEKLEAALVPVAERLRGLAKTIGMISSRFESLINRAEN